MADGVFNIAKGRVIEFYNRVKGNDPAVSALLVMLLKVNEAEADLIDHDDLAALIAAAGNTEADFSNYVRKVLSDVDLAALPAPDDVLERYEITLPNVIWSAAGGAANNTLTRAVVCYDPNTAGGTDSEIVPLTHHDFVATTDGSDLVLQAAASGFFRAV